MSNDTEIELSSDEIGTGLQKFTSMISILANDTESLQKITVVDCLAEYTLQDIRVITLAAFNKITSDDTDEAYRSCLCRIIQESVRLYVVHAIVNMPYISVNDPVNFGSHYKNDTVSDFLFWAFNTHIIPQNIFFAGAADWFGYIPKLKEDDAMCIIAAFNHYNIVDSSDSEVCTAINSTNKVTPQPTLH